MIIPSTGIAGFCNDIVAQCSSSRKERIQRGAMYKNVYYTGDADGNPAIYNKCNSYIQTLGSYLYSPVELRFIVQPYGLSSPTDRAKCQAAGWEVNRHIRQSNVDMDVCEAVDWALIKGKSFIKLLWAEDGFDPYVIQPEFMGVLREDIPQLDKQEAFFHSTYYTLDRFAQLIENHPDFKEIMRKVTKYARPGKDGDSTEKTNSMKQIIIGGLNPYQQAGQAPPNNQQRNIVDWMGGPKPDIDPELLASLIRMDEVYIWDDKRDDYTVKQIVGDDIIIFGKESDRNLFADMYDTDNEERSTKQNDNNPLSGHHPFIEICPNPTDGYFWGRSEIANVALIQYALNKRLIGINDLLRRQENPSIFFSGTSGINQNKYNIFRKPGGYLTDTNPNAKMESLAPELPTGLWESLQEYIKMFDDIGGLAPVMQGRGEQGVRAQGHAETLVRTASPRFKDRALLVERQIDALGGLATDILRAKSADKIEAWVMPKDKSIETEIPVEDDTEQPPAPGMKKIEFLMAHLTKQCRVSVDSHSSSPAFSKEAEGLLFNLFKAGAAKPERLVEHLHPPGADEMLLDLKTAEIEKQMFAAQHPELAQEAEAKAKKKK